LAILEVQQFKRYRLRIISMSCDPNYIFSIDGHELLVIEADGENTEPLPVDSLQIFAGQRYSAILSANNTVQNYWIRSEPNVPRAPSGFEGGINSAILRYVGAPAEDPSTFQNPMARHLREIDLHPLYNPRAPGHPWSGGADFELNIVHEFDFITQQYKLNGVAWESPTVPVLLQILSGAKAPQDLLPKGSIYVLPPNKVIEISLPGTGEGIVSLQYFARHISLYKCISILSIFTEYVFCVINYSVFFLNDFTSARIFSCSECWKR
jgi:iron transport multicopper oxidase